ncbi:MAG TPA: pyrimidine 5'-nucleotidase [Beijerinckiaceae bacterium]|nr:pyrimidine 5'-nucleotidase [Beijerinckiaceae bacterium]
MNDFLSTQQAEYAVANAAQEAAEAESADSLATKFQHVDTWVFDLDNTLYPADSDLWPKIDTRITLFLAAQFGIDAISARALQKYYYQRYGTTLRGMMLEHDISADEFLSFVHDIDRSSLRPNLPLAAAISALPGRRLILTNGSRDHALRTAEQLGFGEIFEDVFDIVAADLIPKPAEETYRRFFERHGVDPKRSAIFEDISHNLAVPHARGMVTTLVVPRQGQADFREAWEKADSAAAHVDYVTDDLEGFLRRIRRLQPSRSPQS